MKNASLLAFALCAGLVLAGPAHATTVDLSGSNYFLGEVTTDQSGTINTTPMQAGALTDYDLSYGTLAPGATITYTYTGLPIGFTVGSADLGQLGNNYYLTSVASQSGVTNTATGSNAFGSTTVNASTLPVTVTASVTGTTGTATIKNDSNTIVSFSSYFAAAASNLTGIGASYNVSSVPLPPAMMLFATAMLGMFGFSRMKKNGQI